MRIKKKKNQPWPICRIFYFTALFTTILCFTVVQDGDFEIKRQVLVPCEHYFVSVRQVRHLLQVWSLQRNGKRNSSGKSEILPKS